MRRPRGRPFTLAAAALVAAVAAATGGCSWLLGVSEDPVVEEPGIDAAGDAGPDRRDAPIE